MFVSRNEIKDGKEGRKDNTLFPKHMSCKFSSQLQSPIVFLPEVTWVCFNLCKTSVLSGHYFSIIKTETSHLRVYKGFGHDKGGTNYSGNCTLTSSDEPLPPMLSHPRKLPKLSYKYIIKKVPRNLMNEK